MAGLEVPLTTKLAGAAEAVVKRRVQAKIEHYLPTATDSVLCDYVLVMVGNKKTSRQVALDLEAFLGPDEAEEFVTWLWELLSTVENKTLDLSGEEVAVPAAEPKRVERRSRSPPRRDERRRSRSRSRSRDGRSKDYSSRARSRSRSRERGGDRRRDDGRRGGRMGHDARRRDEYEYDDRDRGYSSRQGQGGGGPGGAPFQERRGLREPMTSRLLMAAVQSQGQGPRSAARAGGADFLRDAVGNEEVPQHTPGGLRSDAILEETRKHLLHRQQQELQERRAQMQQQPTQAPGLSVSSRLGAVAPAPSAAAQAVGGFGSIAGTDLRNLLSKSRGGTGQRPAGFGGSGGISSRLGPIGGTVSAAAAEATKVETEEPEEPEEEEAAAEAEGDGEQEVSFSVTMPLKALAGRLGKREDVVAAVDGEMEEGEEGEKGYEEYEDGGWEEGADGAGGYVAGYRGRGRGRGAYRGRGGRGGVFAPGVRGRGGFKARGGIRGRGRGGGPVETFAAKKWVNPALAAAASGSGDTAAASGGAATTFADKKWVNPAVAGGAAAAKAVATGGGAAAAGGAGGVVKAAEVESGKTHRPVIGKLNLDGDLDGVGKRGLYKAAKWVKAA